MPAPVQTPPASPRPRPQTASPGPQSPPASPQPQTSAPAPGSNAATYCHSRADTTTPQSLPPRPLAGATISPANGPETPAPLSSAAPRGPSARSPNGRRSRYRAHQISTPPGPSTYLPPP